MSLFGTGRIAAITLRQRILERLGAEPEWITGDPRDNVIGWMASPLTTFLQVEDGPDDAPNLAVLRVMTESGRRAAELAREIFGNPFRPLPKRKFPAEVRGLAEACFDDDSH